MTLARWHHSLEEAAWLAGDSRMSVQYGCPVSKPKPLTATVRESLKCTVLCHDGSDHCELCGEPAERGRS